MSVKERIKKYINSENIQQNDFEKSINASNGYINSIYKSVGLDKLEAILEQYSNLNIEWLLTGKGEMLKNEAVAYRSLNATEKRYPLVGVKAIGGFSNGDFSIDERDVMDYYVVPKFRHKKVDFMIEVEGSSMYPKYNSGDIVACTIINEQSFIQWNKVHVIATKEQGILIKRIKESERNGCYQLISDNKDYPPFEVPKEEVVGIALVAGVIRLE